MSREDIAKRIAEDLLNFDTLDTNNFNGNTDAALKFVESIVLERLKDFTLVQGNIL